MAGLQYELGINVTKFQRGVTDATRGFSQIEQSSAKAFRNVATNANAGAASLTSLGQVARDLPFGFVAIQNNLPIVFDQFGALVKQSGGVAGALKSVGAALIGPAGVTFAIGAAVAGATALIQKYGSLGAAVDALVNSGNKQFQQQQQLVEIQKEASKNAGEEIARLSVLNSVATDTTNSLNNRKEAANELLKVYKEYLPAVNQEAILNNQAADAINAAKDAILNKALAAAAEAKLSEIGAKVLENRLAQVKALERQKTAQEELNAQVAKANKQGLQGRDGVNTTTVFFNTQLEKADANVQKLTSEAELLNEEFQSLLTLSTGFARQAGNAFVKDGPTAKPKKIAGAKPIQVPFEFATVTSDGSALARAQKEIDKATIAGTNPVLTVPVGISIPQTTLDQLKAFGEAAQLGALEERTQGIATAFNDFLAPAINTAFQALANGQNVGQALAQSFKALGVQLGLTLVKALALAAILNAIGGGVINGAKVTGFGNLFKALLGGLPKFAEGGIVNRPTAGIFGEAGPEAIIPLDKLNNLINSVGGGNVNVSGEFRLNGNDLVAVLARTNQRQGRVY